MDNIERTGGGRNLIQERATVVPAAPDLELARFERECRRADKGDWFVTLSGLVLAQLQPSAVST